MNPSTDQGDAAQVQVASALPDDDMKSQVTDDGMFSPGTAVDKTRTALEKEPDARIFGFLGMAYGLVTLTYLCMRTIWLIQGYRWSRNTVAEMMDHFEEKDDTPQASATLNAHAFVGMSLITMFTYQLVSPNLFPLCKVNGELLRSVHRWIGRLAVALLPPCIIAGLAYEGFLKKNRPSGLGFVTGAVFLAIASIAILSNLMIGYFSVAHKPKEERNYLVHKAAMFFAVYLSVMFIVATIVVAVAQAIYDDCGLGHRAQLTIHALTYNIQLAGVFVAIYKWDSRLFACRIVRFNMAVNALHHLLILIAAATAFTQPKEEGDCF